MTKTIGIVEVAPFAAWPNSLGAKITRLATDEVGRECGQPIVVALSAAVFDRQVLPLDVTGFAQSLRNAAKDGLAGSWDALPMSPIDRHRLLLRATGERPYRSTAPARPINSRRLISISPAGVGNKCS